MGGPGTVLEEGIFAGESAHADKHNAVNDQVNWLTDQWNARASDSALVAAMAGVAAPGAAGVAIGDSWLNRNGPYAWEGTGQYYPHLGIFRHAAVALGQRVSLTRNFAVAGKRTDEVLSAQVPQVLLLTPRPAFALVQAGTNDITQGVRTDVQIIASLDAIYTALTSAGIRVIAFTIPPSDTEYDATKLTRMRSVNRWIKAQPPTGRLGVHVVDIFTRLTAKAAPDGGSITNTLATEAGGVKIHPTSKGAALAALTTGGLVDVLASLFPPVDVFPIPGDPYNVAPAPFMVGTAGTKRTGAGISLTGNVATGCFLEAIGTPTAVASKVARTDGLPGEWQQIAVTSGSVALANEAWFTGFTTGDVLEMFVEFQTDANMDTNTTRFDCYMSIGGHAGEPTAVKAGAMLQTPGTPGLDDPTVAWTKMPRSGVLRTPSLVVPAGAVNGDFYIRAYTADGGTFRIGRVAIVKGAAVTVVAG